MCQEPVHKQQLQIVPQELQEQQIENNQENAQIDDEQQEEFSDGNIQIEVANDQEQQQPGYQWQLQGIDREIFLGQNDGNAIGAQQQQHQQPVILIQLNIIQGYIPTVRAIADIHNRIQTDADAVRYMRMIGILQSRFICNNNHEEREMSLRQKGLGRRGQQQLMNHCAQCGR
ncbi:MAG: hypothetical protein EZS28_023377 [Streblomastix strix]|uniref:Uncharacterized protein n=1 Tax=Streblomastix strix TaxID=222440 RepID=A0A5J4VFE7_9EUKA|nr:MAG: hypothetical protein EZS28_023377 [Streblomastix strix]